MLRSGCTYEEIRNRFTIGSSVITDIKKKFKKMNMSIEDLELLPAEEVQEKFYPDVHRRQDKPLPDYKHVYLVTTDKQSRGTLFGQWNEYKEKHPDGYQYSQYKKYYADWRKEHHIDEKLMSPKKGSPVLVHLNRFSGWSATFTIQYTENAFSIEQIVNIINLAGFGNGIGSGRSSGYGRYHVEGIK